MNYDVVIIGQGLAGMAAAMATVSQGKTACLVARGKGNLYCSSGWINMLGYLPGENQDPILNLRQGMEMLARKNPTHPYSLVGLEVINEAIGHFLAVTHGIGLPYFGSAERNRRLPTMAGTLQPTALYPKALVKDMEGYEEITIVGIKELMDFYPAYMAGNLQNKLQAKVQWTSIPLGLELSRELNSYDLAVALGDSTVLQRLVEGIRGRVKGGGLILIPAILGVKNHQQIVEMLEVQTACEVLEIPTFPPSAVGYRLAQGLEGYLKKQGVDLWQGQEVSRFSRNEKQVLGIGVTAPSGRIKEIKGKAFVLASGGILGEGLEVLPGAIREKIFDLPVLTRGKEPQGSLMKLEAQPLAWAGVAVNNWLQPICPESKGVIYNNLFVAGSTLAGYDPFLEKSGNGVALVSGYKAGLMAAQGGRCDG